MVVLLSWPISLVIIGAMTLVLLAFELVRFALPPFNRWASQWLAFLVRRGEDKRVTGTTYFLVASLFTTLVFPTQIAAPAVLFLALGDPAATVFGVWIGRTKLRGKSLEGHLACLAVCLITGIILSRVFVDLRLPIALTGAIAATVFEAVSLPVNDNITIAIGSAAVMWVVSLI